MRVNMKRIGGFWFVALAGLMAFTVTLPSTNGARTADRWTVHNMLNTSLASFFLTEMFEDSSDRLWFAGFDNGASLLDDGAMRTFNASNSVIERRVTSFAEMGNGDIWIGTEDGVAIWDGDDWSTLDMDEVPVAADHVSALLRDSSDRLWVGTWGGGAAVLADEAWTAYAASDELPGDHVWSLAEDTEGRVWIGTKTGLAALAADGDWTTFTTEDSDLVSDRVQSISLDDDGTLYFGTSGKGFSVLDTDGNWSSFTVEDGLPSNFGTSVVEDEDGTLWFGTEGGLASFDGTDWTTYDTLFRKLQYHFIEDLLIDSEGTLWAATFGGGASTWDGEEFSAMTPDTTGMDSNQITVIMEDKDGVVWVGTTYGLNRWDGSKWEVFTEFNSDLAYHYVTGLAQDYKGRIWIGTLSGVSVYDAGTWIETDRFGGEGFQQIPSATVFTIYNDHKGRVWMGTGLGAAVLEDEEWTLHNLRNSGLSTNIISVITQDSLGRMWFTHWQGINIMDQESWHSIIPELNGGFNTFLVWAAMEHSDRSMWFGTLGDGIAIYDGETWTKHNRSTGSLSNDFVRSIAEDDQGRVWVATDGGLNLLIDGKLWLSYTSRNTPLPSDEIDTVMVDRHGSIWIGTQGGLAIFDPGDAANPSLLDQARGFYQETKDGLSSGDADRSEYGDLGDSAAPLGESFETSLIR